MWTVLYTAAAAAALAPYYDEPRCLTFACFTLLFPALLFLHSYLLYTFPVMNPEATENLSFSVSFAGKTNTIPISVPLYLPKGLEVIINTFIPIQLEDADGLVNLEVQIKTDLAHTYIV